jgi:hypothetical protein
MADFKARRVASRAVLPLVADPNPANVRPLPTACAYAYAHAYAAYPPPATATAAAPSCAPSYCTASCAPSYCAVACTASAPSYCAASAPTTSAPTTSGCKPYALAEPGFVFLVEDIKRPQADVGNFLLIESDGRTQ